MKKSTIWKAIGWLAAGSSIYLQHNGGHDDIGTLLVIGAVCFVGSDILRAIENK